MSGFACPLPRAADQTVLLGHGSGGKLSSELLERVFLPRLRNPLLDRLDDAAVLSIGDTELAMTTDAFVVTPRVFPGGALGSLAVHGTVNDLAMVGAVPRYLAASFILEEGLQIAELEDHVQRFAEAAKEAGVEVVCGDTKVVDRGAGDGLYITTTGIGTMRRPGHRISADAALPGDRVLISGPIGLHGIAILSCREGLEFDVEIESDSQPLHDLVGALLDAAGDGVHVLRDPTRGGLASALCEIAETSGVEVRLEIARVPVPGPVQAACEMLGLDPFYVANEGKLVAIVAPEVADAALAAMQAHPRGQGAAEIGEVLAGEAGRVVARTRTGGLRIVQRLTGEQLPRIC